MMTWLAFVQGIYFLITGVWPLVSIDTFQRVTGPKTDLWLVNTVGILIGVIGFGLIAWALTNHVTLDVVVFAIGSAAGLGTIDVFYSLRGVIAKIYLADAVIEAVIVLAWIVAFLLAR